MLDIDMTRTARFAHVRAAGTIDLEDEVDTFISALEFVPEDDDLVVDLSALDRLSTECMIALHGALVRRITVADAVVVATDDVITTGLVHSGVAAVAPIVVDLPHATDILDIRRRRFLLEARR
jgi:hypothetical protein